MQDLGRSHVKCFSLLVQLSRAAGSQHVVCMHNVTAVRTKVNLKEIMMDQGIEKWPHLSQFPVQSCGKAARCNIVFHDKPTAHHPPHIKGYERGNQVRPVLWSKWLP